MTHVAVARTHLAVARTQLAVARTHYTRLTTDVVGIVHVSQSVKGSATVVRDITTASLKE